MAKQASDKPETFLLIWSESKDGYGHVNFDFCNIGEDNKIKWQSGELYDLGIFSQFDTYKGDLRTAGEIYSFDLEFRSVYSINIAKAEQMAKTLKTIHNKLDKYVKEWGTAKTYAQFAMRVAKALGIKRVLSTHNIPYNHRINTSEYSIWDITELDWIIDNEIKKHIK